MAPPVNNGLRFCLIILSTLPCANTRGQTTQVELGASMRYLEGIGTFEDYYDLPQENNFTYTTAGIFLVIMWKERHCVRGYVDRSLETSLNQTSVGFGYARNILVRHKLHLQVFIGAGSVLTSDVHNELGDEEQGGPLLRSELLMRYEISPMVRLGAAIGYEFRSIGAEHEYNRNGSLSESYGYARQFLYPSFEVAVVLSHVNRGAPEDK